MRYEKIRRKKVWNEPRSFSYINKDGEIMSENKKGYWSNITMVQQVRNGAKRMTRVWGGTVAENVSQALARDIFVDKLLDLEKAKLPTIFHVHDEAVLELDEVCAQEQLEEAISIMSTPVRWAEQIPLAADGFLSKVYTK
jgi:DNA polymerase I-like protein with 3'-5' exonuclease and polymerase domains